VLSLCVAIGAVQAFALGRGLARYAQRICVHRLSLDVLGRLRLHLYDVVVPLVPGALGAGGPGAVLSGFVSDTELVAEGFAKTATAVVDVTASTALGTAVAALTEPVLGAIVLCGGAAVVALSTLVTRLGRDTEARAAAERADLAGSVVQTVRSARELVAFGRGDIVEQRLEQVRRRSACLERRRAIVGGVARFTAIAGAGGAVLAVIGAGLDATGTGGSGGGSGAGRLSGVMLAVVAFATLAVMDQCATLPGVLAGRSSAWAAAGRLRALERVAPPVREPGTDRSASATGGSAQLLAVRTAGVEVETVGTAGAQRGGGRRGGGQCGGGQGTAGARPSVLEGVSVEVREGEHVALVGPSGSGKTTAVYALLHFVACSAGEARLGGQDVSCMTREGIATLAGWVPDESHVFAATLRDNLRLACPSATDTECLEALARAGLGTWAGALPAGLATVLGAGGQQVSAGERQRIGLARALLAGPPLLLLDEPTAHLDPGTSARVLAELLGAASDRSVLVVSHDASVVGHVGTVVALDGGHVAWVRRGGRGLRPER
jgi:ATP-binding cassette subfamily C protein CydC/ATP-binding cassette subfamily C protein CydCD